MALATVVAAGRAFWNLDAYDILRPMARLSIMSLLFALIVLFGQTAVLPAFEVASIKEALPLSIENV